MQFFESLLLMCKIILFYLKFFIKQRIFFMFVSFGFVLYIWYFANMNIFDIVSALFVGKVIQGFNKGIEFWRYQKYY